MATRSITSSTTHPLAGGDVSLSIVIGDAQMGSSVVRRGNEAGEVLAIGDVAALPLGPGDALRGGAVYVKSIVTDINDASNFTSITYLVHDGGATTPVELNGAVDEEGGSVVYRMTITFR
jgi:hypothetical protein